MKIKEVKIAGFQTEDAKITLTYQASNTFQRYIIRKNRKIIARFPKEKEQNAKMRFGNIIWQEMSQLTLNII